MRKTLIGVWGWDKIKHQKDIWLEGKSFDISKAKRKKAYEIRFIKGL